MKHLGLLLTIAALAACGDVVKNVEDICEEGLTDCDGECVSTIDDDQHCGDCQITCDAGQACVASQCEDLSSLVIPAFETTPPDTTGWVDSGGDPIAFGFTPIDFEGVTYECRTGPASMIGSVAFGPCDGGDGSQPVHEPAPDPAAEEGSYITEVRAAVADRDFVSDPVSFEFYAHRSLDSVPTCEHALTDAEIFDAAAPQLLADNPPAFADTLSTRNPFVTLPFTNVQPSTRAAQGPPWNTVTGQDFTSDIDSLRRRFAVSPDRQMVLIQRRYASRRALAHGDRDICRNGISHATVSIDCGNFVLNANGESRCVRDVNGETVVDTATPNGFIKLHLKMFSAKGPTENCLGDFHIGACGFYLFLPQ